PTLFRSGPFVIAVRLFAQSLRVTRPFSAYRRRTAHSERPETDNPRTSRSSALDVREPTRGGRVGPSFRCRAGLAACPAPRERPHSLAAVPRTLRGRGRTATPPTWRATGRPRRSSRRPAGRAGTRAAVTAATGATPVPATPPWRGGRRRVGGREPSRTCPVHVSTCSFWGWGIRPGPPAGAEAKTAPVGRGGEGIRMGRRGITSGTR